MSSVRETLTLLYWSLLQPASFRHAVAEGRIELERARWEGLALVIGVPLVVLLTLQGLASALAFGVHLSDARTFLQVSVALASVLCLVGSVPEGVAFGVAGGLTGIVLASNVAWQLPFPFDFTVLFGAALGMAYRTRRGSRGTWRYGLIQAVRGGLVFAVVFGLEEAGFLFFNLWPGSTLTPALGRAGERFLSVWWRTGTYFAVPFLTFYLGLLWYPVEAIWATVVSVLARVAPRTVPALAHYHPAQVDRLLKLPLPGAPHLPPAAGSTTESGQL